MCVFLGVVTGWIVEFDSVCQQTAHLSIVQLNNAFLSTQRDIFSTARKNTAYKIHLHKHTHTLIDRSDGNELNTLRYLILLIFNE